ncbi:Formin-like protein [Gryllus bimaculatus]|nr:Formin-like protein [Gryllus bimaculatus]
MLCLDPAVLVRSRHAYFTRGKVQRLRKNHGRQNSQEALASGTVSRRLSNGLGMPAVALEMPKVTGTIWSELDETKLYTAMELDNIDKIFCAYQKNGVTNEGSIEDLRQLGKSRAKILSVIDGRRAQNCTILLSKLKMSDEDISKIGFVKFELPYSVTSSNDKILPVIDEGIVEKVKCLHNVWAIMGMDGRNQLPIDMVELLLNFIPSAEECALLEEHSEDIEHLARADRFLYEISKIPHYEQRLRALHYKKRFGLWMSEVQPRIRAVMEASREVARSRRLRRLLEVVLALGNYMNRGARGNAYGFRLASLNRLADTKSSALKGTTLLHYLVEILEKKFKDTLKLDEDLPHIRDAAKVNMGELEKDMGQLRNGLKEVEREVEFHRSQPAGVAVAGDRFLPVMKEFLSSATCRFSELEDLFQDMKTRTPARIVTQANAFDRAVRLFGEDNSNIQPDEFFGIFDAFLTAFNEARQDNENMRRRREEEEKRAQQEAEVRFVLGEASQQIEILVLVSVELKKRTMDRKNSKEGILSKVGNSLKNGLSNGLGNGRRESTGDAKGEFDDLISALRTGDVFGEDMAKFKRSRKARLNTNGSSPTRLNSLNREDSRERVLNSNRKAQ